MIHNYLRDELVEYIIGEVTFLTDLGETLDSAMHRVRRDLEDSIDIGIASLLILRHNASLGGN